MITRLKRHCPETWAAFYREHVRGVWGFAYRRLGTPHAADEVVSQTFLAAVESIERLNPKAGAPQQWLFGIARRKLAETLRKQYRWQKRKTGRPVEETGVDPLAEKNQRNETRDRVHETLESLPPQCRDVLLWRYREEASVHEIAERLNRTEKAAENLLYRARLRFKENYTQLIESEENPILIRATA